MLALYGEWLQALESSGLGHLARHSAWTFTLANVLHVLGAALVLGAIAVFDVKVLVEHGRGAAGVGRIAIPLAASGLILQLPTGLVLLAAEATALGHNPAFGVKLGLIALGLVNVGVFHRLFRNPGPGGDLPQAARLSAALSLVAWGGTLAAGRMIAYL